MSYDEVRDAADKLRRKVRSLLQEYYRTKPDQDFHLDIIDERDRFEPFLKAARSEHLAASALLSEGLGISVSQEWKSDRIHQLLRTAVAATTVRIHTTGFVDPRAMRAALSRALQRGVRIHMLQVDPKGPLIQARFRLRPELTVEEFRREMGQQQAMLKALNQEGLSSSLEIRDCDLMPFGHFIQGESTDVGPWMIIGLFPPLASYSDGPMIEIKPTAAELWNLFEANWTRCWESPIQIADQIRGATSG